MEVLLRQEIDEERFDELIKMSILVKKEDGYYIPNTQEAMKLILRIVLAMEKLKSSLDKEINLLNILNKESNIWITI